jgi:hypothetical protein
MYNEELHCKVHIIASSLARYVKKAGGQISIQDTKDHFVKDWCPSNGE